MSSDYLDRLLRAAMKRRRLDGLALHALMKATHLLGLALAERIRESAMRATLSSTASRSRRSRRYTQRSCAKLSRSWLPLGQDPRTPATPLVSPPRGRRGEGTRIPPPPFEVRYLDPERRLPYLVRKAA